MLCQQSGTLSLTKTGHPTPSHPSDYHLKLIIFSSPTECVWERERKGEGERKRKGERESTSGLWLRARFVFSSTYFVSCKGPCAPKEKWHRKEHIIIIIITCVCVHALYLCLCVQLFRSVPAPASCGRRPSSWSHDPRERRSLWTPCASVSTTLMCCWRPPSECLPGCGILAFIT